jgi:hypothetical protein
MTSSRAGVRYLFRKALQLPDQSRDPLFVCSVVATADLAQLRSYVRRGRGLEGASDTHLTDIWCEGMRTWAKDARTRPTTLDDAEAELSLRGVQLPVELVEDEIAAVIEGAEEILAATDPVHPRH